MGEMSVSIQDAPNDEDVIKAQLEIIRVQIMSSGAVRVVLEASEHRTDLLQTLADIRRAGGLLEVAMLPVLPQEENKKSWLEDLQS